MNLICPSCQRTLQISEQFAGQVLKCPHCSAPYSVPVLPQPPVLTTAASPEPAKDIYSLATPEPPPNPSRIEAPPPSGTASPMDGMPLPQPAVGYRHLYSIWLQPKVIQYIPPAALTLVFILMFFNWIVVLARLDAPLTGWQTGFGSRLNGFGLIFNLAFLLSWVAALAALVLPRLPAERLHASVREVLPWRSAIVFGLTAFACLFLALEIVSGFGADNEPSLGTGWFRLAVMVALIALVSAGLEWWLAVRGPQQPVPRIDISW